MSIIFKSHTDLLFIMHLFKAAREQKIIKSELLKVCQLNVRFILTVSKKLDLCVLEEFNRSKR